MDKGYIGVTAREWFTYLKGNNINEEVNFWRKNTNNFKVIEIGEPFFFLVKNEKGVKSERQILGYGIFKRFEVLDINIAWEKYGYRNGNESKDEYLKRMLDLFDKDSGDIGCIILDNIKYFDNAVVLSNLGIKFDNSVVSGKGITGEEVNSIISAGYSSTSRIFNSWEILNDKIALKTVDKSVFFHNGSGIPIGTRPFFEINNMNAGERKEIQLAYKNIKYNARFEFERQKTARTRLFWNSDFRDILKLELPKYYDLFDEEKGDTDIELPKIRFEKIDEYNFHLEFIIMDDIKEDVESEEVENSSKFNDKTQEIRTEGRVKYTYGKKYERDPKNRADAIAYHGTKCKICKFDFEKRYGSRGKGYIEIHHINPLSNVGEEVIIDPKTDLIPVCANCHRMIHRRKENILSIDEMKELINENKMD